MSLNVNSVCIHGLSLPQVIQAVSFGFLKCTFQSFLKHIYDAVYIFHSIMRRAYLQQATAFETRIFYSILKRNLVGMFKLAMKIESLCKLSKQFIFLCLKIFLN